MTRSRDTANIIPTVDAKGDLIVGVGDNSIDNLPVGTDGQVLKVNSETSTGLEWASDAQGISAGKSIALAIVFGG